MDVQMQSGTYDCGLFAVAFATALAFGYNPGQYFFDQPSMRSIFGIVYGTKICQCFLLLKSGEESER